MTSSGTVLVVSDLAREIDGKPIVANISFSLNQGDILFVRGPSGVGKSLLLRALAALDPIQVRRMVGSTTSHAELILQLS